MITPNRRSRTVCLHVPWSLATIPVWCVALSACDGARVASDGHVDVVPYLTAAAEMRIGDADDPDVGFSRVSRVDVDRDGNIYVMEGLVPEIRVFSPEGVLLRRIGRRGSGR